MVNLEAFGHFFGFTATANYATTLYKEMQGILFSVITDFKAEDLAEERKIYEENNQFFLELSKDEIREMTNEENRKSQLARINLEKIKLNLEEVEVNVNFFLNEIDSNAYQDNFEKKVRPLFPLAGTYSVVILLIGAFSQVYESETNFYLNILLLVNIFMTILIYVNIRVFDKSRSVSSRNLFLHKFLIALFGIAIMIAFIITRNDFYLFSFYYLSELFVLVWSLLLSGIGSIALIYKYYAVNRRPKQLIKSFREMNLQYENHLRYLLRKTK